ncbi:GIY-YIG nuclease family protein [Thalassospira sp. SM2505]|uniref:GIY-YIG nuclease family protein n=1 Tax=Thalassospira profundimaris TaxID=502049 RepID=UPI00215D615F|nr:GIY-YIG nuclease family protein [Thalassospira profundimaris]
MTQFIETINDQTLRQLPKVAGAYVLVIELANDLVLQNKRFAGTILPKGTYLYCGSANGPGGIAARVKRHCKQDKKPHWHVDELTSNGAGRIVSVLVVPGGNECELRARLQRYAPDVPVTGFGSSDCTDCSAHLMSVPVNQSRKFGKIIAGAA